MLRLKTITEVPLDLTNDEVRELHEMCQYVRAGAYRGLADPAKMPKGLTNAEAKVALASKLLAVTAAHLTAVQARRGK